MAKKEILIFTRSAVYKLESILDMQNYTIVKHLEDAAENQKYKYPQITAFITADQRMIDIEELLWTGEFASLEECEKCFSLILDAYWRFSIRNNFHCMVATLNS